MKPYAYEIPLTSEVIEAVSRLKARIVVTIYAPKKLFQQTSHTARLG